MEDVQICEVASIFNTNSNNIYNIYIYIYCRMYYNVGIAEIFLYFQV